MNKLLILISVLIQISLGITDAGTDQYTINYNIPIGLSIISFSPLSDSITLQGTAQTFNITLNKMANITWYMNGSQVQTNTSTTLANYTNSTASVGIWNVSVIATDDIDTVSKTWNWTVNVQSPTDITPPITNISLSGTLGNNSWYISNVSATLSATDDISGINYTKYNINNGSWFTYTIPFIVSTESTNTVYYYSVDNASNKELNKSQTIKIDKTPPGSITNIGNTHGRTYINWTWTDPTTSDTSGFAYVMVYLNGLYKTNVSKGVRFYNATGLLPNTNYRLNTHTVDNAGNINPTWVNSSNVKTNR